MSLAFPISGQRHSTASEHTYKTLAVGICIVIKGMNLQHFTMNTMVHGVPECLCSVIKFHNVCVALVPICEALFN